MSDGARRLAFEKAERVEAAQTAVDGLTDDECQMLYVKLEIRLAGSANIVVDPPLVSPSPQPHVPPVAQSSELPYVEAKRRATIEFEREYLTRVMTLANNSVTDAAHLAGIDRTNFRRMLQRNGLRVRRAQPTKSKPAARYTDEILKLLDDNPHGLRTCEIAERTKRPLHNASGTLKSLARQGRAERHGNRYNTVWTRPGVSPTPRIESIPAAAIAVLATATCAMDASDLRDEIGATLLRNTGKRPSKAAVKRSLSRLVSSGTLETHGVNEHGPLFVLAEPKGGSDLN